MLATELHGELALVDIGNNGCIVGNVKAAWMTASSGSFAWQKT